MQRFPRRRKHAGNTRETGGTRAKKCVLDAHSRRNAAASAAIFLCAECASFRKGRPLITGPLWRIHCFEVISMQSCEFAVSISTLACCIAEGKSPEELALISSVLMQLGDTLATIAAHQALCGPKEQDT